MFCYCRKCHPGKYVSKRTLKLHLNDDINHLEGGDFSDLYFLSISEGIERNRESLASVNVAGAS